MISNPTYGKIKFMFQSTNQNFMYTSGWPPKLWRPQIPLAIEQRWNSDGVSGNPQNIFHPLSKHGAEKCSYEKQSDLKCHKFLLISLGLRLMSVDKWTSLIHVLQVNSTKTARQFHSFQQKVCAKNNQFCTQMPNVWWMDMNGLSNQGPLLVREPHQREAKVQSRRLQGASEGMAMAQATVVLNGIHVIW